MSIEARRRSASPRSAYFIAVLTLSALFNAANAFAMPRPLPFTYDYETLGEGEVGVAQYADLTPVVVLSTANAGIWAPSSQFQTEFAYGVTNHLELGLYVTLAPTPINGESPQSIPPSIEGNGVKERLRLRLFDEGVLPVDVGLFGELTENEREFEIQAKILLQKRLGNLRIVANLSGRHEWSYASTQQGNILDPSAGVTYQATSVFQPGIDSWMASEFSNVAAANGTPFNDEPNVYVGPAILLSFPKFWWSTGAYVRVTNLDHAMVAGQDVFGLLWFRMIVGLTL